KGVALSTASNWLWNFAIGFITPYMVDKDAGNLQAKVFFIWGTTCTLSLLFSYFFVSETKGLSLEQVDRMLEETNPRNSAKWRPHDPFAHEMGLAEKGPEATGTTVAHQEKVSKRPLDLEGTWLGR